MPQIKFLSDLNVAEYPLLTKWMPRTVVQDAPDGSTLYNRPPISHPQVMYLQDVLPTKYGYKSVGYKQLVAAPVTPNLNFAQEITAIDQSQNKALIGVALNSKIYMLTAASPLWQDVTPASWAGGDAVTYGIVNGITYLYLANFGCYAVNITGVSLTATTLIGITAANILGMSAAVNYMLLWDASGTVYWDSTVNPLDFTPSIITGAGSEIPADLSGKIVVIVPLSTSGFAIYTTQNIVLASFSNNTQFPWLMRNAAGSSGINHYSKVSLGQDLGFHVAATYAGILQVTQQGCTTIVPEAMDFLAARIYESYDFVNNVIVSTVLDTVLAYRITIVGARYTILSFGVTAIAGTQQIYTDALVYDTVLKRWGRISIDHTCIFEIDVNLEGVISPYTAASEVGQTYASASPQSYISANTNISNPPQVGRIIGCLGIDGTVSLASEDYSSYNQNSVMWLGKYQSTRDYNLVLEELLVEEITSDNTNFNLLTIPSYNGRDLSAPLTPVVIELGTKLRRYGMRTEAQNHIIVLLGSFSLSALQLTAQLGGRR